MNSNSIAQPFNPAQLEILKMFNKNFSEQELIDLKKILIQFLAAKITEKADEIWDKNHWTIDHEEKLLATKMRTGLRK